MYNILIKKYGYKKENIFVIMADGTDPAPDRRLLNGQIDSSPLDLDSDGLPDIQYAATRSNINTVFNNLANRLNRADDLFIFTADHGDRIGNNSALVLWNNQLMFDYEFASSVKRINAKSINIVMGQCYSGGFIDDFKGNDNITVSTACSFKEVSYARKGLLYDEFLYHWMSCAYDKKIDGGNILTGDKNSDGYITANECFRYASFYDQANESPSSSISLLSLGEKLTLNGFRNNLQPIKIWANHVRVDGSAVYLNVQSSRTLSSNVYIYVFLMGDALHLDDDPWDPRLYKAEYEFDKYVKLESGRTEWTVKVETFYGDPKFQRLTNVYYQGYAAFMDENNFYYSEPGKMSGSLILN